MSKPSTWSIFLLNRDPNLRFKPRELCTLELWSNMQYGRHVTRASWSVLAESRFSRPCLMRSSGAFMSCTNACTKCSCLSGRVDGGGSGVIEVLLYCTVGLSFKTNWLCLVYPSTLELLKRSWRFPAKPARKFLKCTLYTCSVFSTNFKHTPWHLLLLRHPGQNLFLVFLLPAHSLCSSSWISFSCSS